jgi:hypothetical protein
VFREFKGDLVGMTFPVENNRPKSKLQFANVEIIKTVAAYLHPTAEIVMNRTSRNGGAPSDRSPWGKLIISSDEQGYPDIIDLKGHRLHMQATEQNIPADPERNQEAGTFLTWNILSVDSVDRRPPPEETPQATAPVGDFLGLPSSGFNGVVDEDYLLTLIDGKTMGEFTQAALNLAMPSALRAKLLDSNNLVPGWIANNQVTTDGSTYTKVPQPIDSGPF